MSESLLGGSAVKAIVWSEFWISYFVGSFSLVFLYGTTYLSIIYLIKIEREEIEEAKRSME